MKSASIFHYCEFCNHGFEECSPPSEEAYASGVIDIIRGGMTILRPEPKDKINNTDHSFLVEGLFFKF